MWCKGSTIDFGSIGLGSIPGISTNKNNIMEKENKKHKHKYVCVNKKERKFKKQKYYKGNKINTFIDAVKLLITIPFYGYNKCIIKEHILRSGPGHGYYYCTEEKYLKITNPHKPKGKKHYFANDCNHKSYRLYDENYRISNDMYVEYKGNVIYFKIK